LALINNTVELALTLSNTLAAKELTLGLKRANPLHIFVAAWQQRLAGLAQQVIPHYI